MEVFVLFLIPAVFLVSLGNLIFAKSFPLRAGSMIAFVITSTILLLVPAALLNYGAAWSGGPTTSYLLWGAGGFFGSLVLGLAIFSWRPSKRE
ncbi:MAG: hypothetical protein AAGF67_09275 [Verrucomicrobiota bacterium]